MFMSALLPAIVPCQKKKKAGFHEMNKSILVHNSSVFPTVALSLSINFQVGAGLGSGL